MTTATVAHEFTIATHNGKITVTNPAGDHRTFQIKTQKADAKFAPGERIVGLLIGQDNQNDFQSFGFVKDDGRVVVWSKYRGTQFERLAKMLTNAESEAERFGLEFLWSATCRRCNRELTTPESIKSGIGPTCAEKE